MTVVSSRGCLGLKGERRIDPAHDRSEDFPPRPAPSREHRSVSATRQAVATTWTWRTMAHKKPTISRAIAVTITTFSFPAAASRR